jgi:hypothetical protein
MRAVVYRCLAKPSPANHNLLLLNLEKHGSLLLNVLLYRALQCDEAGITHGNRRFVIYALLLELVARCEKRDENRGRGRG